MVVLKLEALVIALATRVWFILVRKFESLVNSETALGIVGFPVRAL